MTEENYVGAPENEKKGPTKKKYRRDIIIAVILVLVLVQAVNLFIKMRSDKAYNAEIEKAKEEITILEHEVNQRMVEIESLGGDVEDLKAVVAELEDEKEKLITNRKYSDRQIASLRDKVEGFQELLVIKDKEIEELKTVNQELVTENIELKTEKNELTANLNEEIQNRVGLEEQIDIVSKLKAENIEIYALNSRGKSREDEFKARFIDKIRVEFNIAENEVAPIEGKDIMIRIVGPDDNVLFDVASGSGTFMFNGKEEFYTAKQEILFDNTRQKLSFDYDKGSAYVPGQYALQVYTDDYLMGEKEFMVK
jgi:regulator of replication initiation timing